MTELPLKQISQFIKAHAAGMTMDELSRKFGIRKSTAIAITKRYGISRRKGPRPEPTKETRLKEKKRYSAALGKIKAKK